MGPCARRDNARACQGRIGKEGKEFPGHGPFEFTGVSAGVSVWSLTASDLLQGDPLCWVGSVTRLREDVVRLGGYERSRPRLDLRNLV